MVDTSGWQRVETSDGGLSVALPAGWKVDPPDGGDAVLVAAPVDEAAPVLVVEREPRHGSESAADHALGNIIYLQQTHPDFRDHGGGRWEQDGPAVSWYCYSYRAGGIDMTFMLFAVVSASSAYLLVCAAPGDEFPRHRPTIEAIGRGVRPGPTFRGGDSLERGSPGRR